MNLKNMSKTAGFGQKLPFVTRSIWPEADVIPNLRPIEIGNST
jgi:hypothetical protein